MAVSNPATMSSIKSEFGGPNNLSAYVRGGTYVPMNAANQISTTVSGLAVSQFSGVIKPVSVYLTKQTIHANSSGLGGNPLYANLYLKPNGKYQTGGLYWDLEYGVGFDTVSLEYKIKSINAETSPGTNFSPQATTNWLPFTSEKSFSAKGKSKTGPSPPFDEIPPGSYSANWTVGFRVTGQTSEIGTLTIVCTAGSW